MQEAVFQSVLIAPCYFLEKRTFWKFLEIALPAVFPMARVAHYEWVRLSGFKHCQYRTGQLVAFRKTTINIFIFLLFLIIWT